MRSLKYTVALYHSEEGYSVSCPGLPGCWSQGETEAEAIANIQVAIQEYLAAIAEMVPSGQLREVDVLV
jgi:predicted RNase H-like HicB family nuclease